MSLQHDDEPPALARQLAQWLNTLQFEALPAAVVADARLRILDTLGLMLSGADTPIGRAVHRASPGLGSGEQSRLIPSGERTSASIAALAHGTQAHAEDFDDTHNESIMHSSASVVATVLALGEARQISGEEAIVLVAAGNELNCRLGCIAAGGFHQFGFHPTGVLGAISAAFVAGRILDLEPGAATHAAGIAGSQASGILEAYEDGSWSKTLHPGWAAHAGIVAATLAQAGFSGPATVLEGRFGVFRAFLHGTASSNPATLDFGRLTAQLGEDWEQLNSSFKPYPCAHAIHAFVDAALDLRRTHELSPAQIARIDATVAPHFVAMICEPSAAKLAPRTPTHARASLPYALAAALNAGQLGPAQYSTEAIANPDVLALAARVNYQLDTAPPPTTQYRGQVAIHTHDGRHDTRVVEYNRGSRENPMTLADIVAKFDTCASSLKSSQRSKLLKMILRIEEVNSIDEVITACT